MSSLRNRLAIDEDRLREVNSFLSRRDNPLINNMLAVIEKSGGVKELNSRAKDAQKIDNIMKRLEAMKSPFVKDLSWLMRQREKEAFVSIPEFHDRILGKKSTRSKIDESFAVTLEISALNFFPWLIEEAKKAITDKGLMPSRYIRVRSMKEQIEDGDILALAAAMHLIGASYVQTLDTKGTLPGPDGKPINVHLGGPDTITGYFGGVGEPNDYTLRWVEELLHYYSEYGLSQVLNTNSGTVLLGYWLRKLGINIEFKISVFLGNDNPYSILWTLLTAKLFSSEDGSTPLIGFNLSNSVNNETIELTAQMRKSLGFEDIVRIEHHITEAYKNIVRQPYDRTAELVKLADHVRNISAKHEGGKPETEAKRNHPSDILDYFMPKKDIIEKGLMPELVRNYLDKHDAVNETAEALVKHGIPFIAATNLHQG